MKFCAHLRHLWIDSVFSPCSAVLGFWTCHAPGSPKPTAAFRMFSLIQRVSLFSLNVQPPPNPDP